MAPEARTLADFLSDTESITVLSGAGISTSSGIPDYRDRNGDWKQSQPIQFGDFVRSVAARQRYWSRSYVGWQRFSKATPNAAHEALATLEASGKVDTLITQNVDELHTRAGSRKVIDLHGKLSKVRCLECDAIVERAGFQVALEAANPDWHASVAEIRADGDVELQDVDERVFNVPGCENCGGMMKPDVVMLGDFSVLIDYLNNMSWDGFADGPRNNGHNFRTITNHQITLRLPVLLVDFNPKILSGPVTKFFTQGLAAGGDGSQPDVVAVQGVFDGMHHHP